jgi:NADH-quinone oxidoreductase subunit L
LSLNEAERFGSSLAYVLLMAGVFITAFYSFRMFFLVFHGEESEYVKTHQIKESPWVVTVPLILLAIPTVLMGLPMFEPMLTGAYFGDSIYVQPANDVMLAVYTTSFNGVIDFVVHSLLTLPVILALLGVFLAWLLYVKVPTMPAKLKKMCPRGFYVLDSAYGFDRLNDIVFVDGTRKLGHFFSRVVDTKIIDVGMVTNTFMTVANSAKVLRQTQTGFLYHYAFVMILGLLVMLVWTLW